MPQTKTIIEVIKKPEHYRAQLKERTNKYGVGTTSSEAVVHLLASHPKIFNLKITFLRTII